MECNDQNQFDRWLRLNKWTAPCLVVDSAVFVRDTLELSKVIARAGSGLRVVGAGHSFSPARRGVEPRPGTSRRSPREAARGQRRID